MKTFSSTACIMWLRCLPAFGALLFASQNHSQNLFPYAMPWNDTAANFTNLSNWNDKPAGRSDFVTVREGHLYAREKRLRMIGVNIVFASCFPTHEDAEGVAARLSRLGVNIVRFHHMDSSPAPRGILQRDMRTIDPAQLERFDYFIAALKREGIYSDINLHVAASIRALPIGAGRRLTIGRVSTISMNR